MRPATILQLLLAAILTLFLLATSIQCQSSQTVALERPPNRPLNMLVLGDSLMWGLGLQSENKTWHQIKIQLAQQTGRPVIQRIEAHSGAIIETEAIEKSRVSVDGEVNLPLPSIRAQVDQALRYYADGSEVDLVLVSGCANDVQVKNVLNAENSREEIRRLTEAKCGQPMERLLQKITSSFPAAYVIVTGYYPFISAKTRNDLFTRGLTKRFYKAIPAAAKLPKEAIFYRMVANSDEWYHSSNRSLGQAVKNVNAGFSGGKSQGRIMFAQVHLLPEHSFRAPKTQLWNFESNPLRKLLVILFFGRILLQTNDETRKQRSASCKQFWKALPNENSRQKKERKNQLLLCRYAALGHPNREGALVYAEAIGEQLKAVIPLLGSKKLACFILISRTYLLLTSATGKSSI